MTSQTTRRIGQLPSSKIFPLRHAKCGIDSYFQKMASLSQHNADCLLFLGTDCEAVNKWMDEFFAIDGPYHRKHRHHREGVEEARSIFGEIGAKAAIVHILRDCRQIPAREDYASGKVDVLGLRKSWPVTAYIRYSQQEFESLVTNKLFGSQATVLWSFVNEGSVRLLLQNTSRLDPGQIEKLMPEWAAASKYRESLEPLEFPQVENLTSFSPSALDHIGKFTALGAFAQTEVVGGVRFGFIDAAQLINPLVYFDNDYIEELRPELRGTDELDLVWFAFPETVVTSVAAAVDSTLRGAMFISTQKALTVTPVKIEDTPNGTNVTFTVATGINFIHVGNFGGRLFLKNGMHRAFLLLKNGISQIPCAVVDEPALPASFTASYPSFTHGALLQPRPPLLTDFLKPNLATEVPIQRTNKLIRIFSEESVIPVL